VPNNNDSPQLFSREPPFRPMDFRLFLPPAHFGYRSSVKIQVFPPPYAGRFRLTIFEEFPTSRHCLETSKIEICRESPYLLSRMIRGQALPFYVLLKVLFTFCPRPYPPRLHFFNISGAALTTPHYSPPITLSPFPPPPIRRAETHTGIFFFPKDPPGVVSWCFLGLAAP